MANEAVDRDQLSPELYRLTELARGSHGRMSPEQCLRGEQALGERLVDGRAARRVWLMPGAAAAFSALVLVSALAFRHGLKSGPPSLSYVIENGSAAGDQALDVDRGPPRVVRFSDGTEVRVERGTRARVRSLTSHGAELSMTTGALHATVIHSGSSEWRFDAGPFIVHVTGTAFGLSWDPELDRFDLRLERGSVSVSGPVVSDPISMRAGQWLTIRPRSNEVFIRDLTGERARDSAAEASHAAELGQAEPEPSALKREPEVAQIARSAQTVRPMSGMFETSHDWARDLSRGKSEQIVDDALRLGLDNCLQDSSPRELSALADAARYTRKDDIARKVLIAERRRFPGSSSAAGAGLLLGRLAEAQGNGTEALAWFDTYLAEAPTGLYAAEALGRKMALVRRSVGANAARLVADQYLLKYPDGTYASAARAILKSP